jgi:hypothetical protein
MNDKKNFKERGYVPLRKYMEYYSKYKQQLFPREIYGNFLGYLYIKEKHTVRTDGSRETQETQNVITLHSYCEVVQKHWD